MDSPCCLQSANSTCSSSSWNFEPPRTLLFRFLLAYDPVNKAYTPILFLFGTIGNCLSVIVFCKAPSHRYRSSSLYLLALAISDIGYLVNLLIVWLEDSGVTFLTSPWVCPVVMYFGNVTCFLSVWLTVSFTAERFYAVCFPLSRPVVCTGARAKKVIIMLLLLALVIFSYILITAHVVNFPVERGSSTSPSPSVSPFSSTVNNDTELDSVSSRGNYSSLEDSKSVEGRRYMRLCYVREDYENFTRIASHIDSLITFILPFFLITYLNSRIVHCLWKLKKEGQLGVAAANTKSHFRNYTSASIYRGTGSHSSPELSQCTNSNYRMNSGSCTSINTCNSTGIATVANGSFNNRPNSFSPLAAEKKVTKTLLLVSTVFLALNLPAHAIRALSFIQSWGWGMEVSEEIQALQQWANILFNTNFGINFLLYCVCGMNFRKSLSIIFCRRKSSIYPPSRRPRHVLNCPANQLDSCHQSRYESRRHDKIIIVNF